MPMKGNTEAKSRREKRKEARQEKKQKRHDSWVKHKELQKLRRVQQRKAVLGGSKPKYVNKAKNLFSENLRDVERRQEGDDHRRNESEDEADKATKLGMKSELLRHDKSANGEKRLKGNKSLKRKSKRGFEKYLEMGMKEGVGLAEKDLEMERRLSKKLKLKDGNLRGMDDEINMLLEGIPSVLDSLEEVAPDTEELPINRGQNGISIRKPKKLKSPKEFSEDEIDGDDIAGGFSEMEENCGVKMGLDGGDILKSSTKKCRKRKKSKHKQDASGDMASVIPEPDGTLDADEEMLVTPTKVPMVAATVKYIPPHLRLHAGSEPVEHTQIRRRVRGLLNRLSESNVESVTGEMASIFRSVSRSVSTQIISDEMLTACSGGPRGNERYAAVFAAFVAGMACHVGMDFSAKLMASLAECFQDEYLKEDNISLRNLTLLLSYLYIFGVCSSDLIYDFLIMLSERLTEVDVSTILTVLQCCGMKIRGDDPASMKIFIQCVQNRVNNLKASSGEGHININGKRMEFMLETICDIKNNKKRPKEENTQHTRIKKWLQKLRVEDIFLRGLKWSNLLDPDKKGQWWLSGDMAGKTDNVEEVANTIDKEVLEAQKLLQLAASQRMTTDARKAIFCVIMSGEDYIDAFEKLLRLDLPGKQDREIMRVLVECCLQEEVFNKYYTVLASKLCEHDKNHKFTLQCCLWDHFKELESMQLLRSMHLAKFVAEMIASFTVSLAVLKSVELGDAAQLTPKRIMHFRMLFEALFDFPDKVVWNAFTRVAVTPELEALRDGIGFFVREYVVKTNNAVTNKFKVAKRALNNTEGVLM